MASFQVNKTIQEINEKIKQGKAVVLTAEEMIEVVRKKGEVAAAREVDVPHYVLTGEASLTLPARGKELAEIPPRRQAGIFDKRMEYLIWNKSQSSGFNNHRHLSP